VVKIRPGRRLDLGDPVVRRQRRHDRPLGTADRDPGDLDVRLPRPPETESAQRVGSSGVHPAVLERRAVRCGVEVGGIVADVDPPARLRSLERSDACLVVAENT
jgi:hypothetical protein